MVKQIVWDMDGTLIDSAMAVSEAFTAAIVELGGPSVTSADIIDAQFVGVPEVILAHFLGRKLRRGEEEAYYDRIKGLRLYPYPGVIDTLRALRARNLVIAVFTGASTRAALTICTAAEIDVDVLVASDQIAHPKPAPDGLLRIAEELSIVASDIAYVGDSPTDLQAARAAGCTAVAAAWGHLYDPDEETDVTASTPASVLSLLGYSARQPC